MSGSAIVQISLLVPYLPNYIEDTLVVKIYVTTNHCDLFSVVQTDLQKKQRCKNRPETFGNQGLDSAK